MNTIPYRGWQIVQHPENGSCDILLPDGGLWTRTRSLASAKNRITRDLKWVRFHSVSH